MFFVPPALRVHINILIDSTEANTLFPEEKEGY